MADSGEARQPVRVAMTLDIKRDKLEQYYELHQNVWPEVKAALHSVGVRNLSLWVWGTRMFYYCEYVGEEPFDDAMARYAEMPRVKDWEAQMHQFQERLPGSDGDVWWQPMRNITHQD